MKSPYSVRATIVRAAFLTACFSAPATADLITAGSLLIDLDALDYRASDATWPQHTQTTGIPGSFTKTLANGTPQLQTVAGRKAVVLDGDGDFLTGPSTTAALHGLNATHSVEYWVYQGHTRPEEAVISWAARGTPNGSHAAFRYGSAGNSGAVGHWGGPDMGFAAPHAGGPAVGQWHLITVTYDGTTQRIYVDGVPNASEVVSLDAKDGYNIYIGTERNTDGADAGRGVQFSGAISKVRVHSGVLTEENVKNNYDFEAPEHPGITTADLSRPPLHRWSFSEAAGPAADGSIVVDSIGGLSAVIRGTGAVLTGSGVTLPGGVNSAPPFSPYVDLPNGLISSKQRVSFETWVAQTSTQSGSRMITFSKSNIGEINAPGNIPAYSATQSIALHANAGGNPHMRLERVGGTYSNGGNGRTSENATNLTARVHYAVVYDPEFKEWRSYREGYLMETLPETQGPTTIGDVNNWLGRSEYGGDSGFAGTFDEFRIYNYTLSESEIRGNTIAGPDTLTSSAAASFAWTPTEGGTYAFDNAGGQDNWDPGTSFPDAAGATATLASNITGDQVLELNTTATVGNLNLGDTDGSHTFTLAPGAGGVLDLNAGPGANASLTQSSTSAANVISAPLLLSSNTEIANTSQAAPLTLAGALSGSGKLAKSGTGPVQLSADNSAYGGSIAINGGALRVGDGGTSGTLGSGPVTINSEASLALNRSDAFSFNANISGTGNLNAMGSGRATNTGTVNLTGTPGALLVSPGGSFSNEGSFTTAFSTIEGELVSDQPNTLVTGELVIGNLLAGPSVMRLSAGTVDAATIVVGRNIGTSGVILQSGGTLLDRSGGTDCYIGGGNNDAKDVWGAYRMSGGVFNTTNHFQIGSHGTGVMEVFGDAVVNFNAGVPSIGRFQNAAGAPKSRGLLDVRGGGVVNQTLAGARLNVGEKATGTLNIRDGGTVNLTGGLGVGLGNANEGDGTVNLMAGGTLSTAVIVQGNGGTTGAGIGRFNFHGGTLRARGNQANFMGGLDEALVYSEGAVIDTNGFAIGTTQGFSDPGGNGVAIIPVTNGGSGYLAPPYLEIVGTGTGATAIANLTDGVVTSITITNPGTNYDVEPTVNVLGGGAGSGLTFGAPALAVNLAGTFTKTGPGTLTLNGSSFYTGPTDIEQGTLVINGDHFSATGKITVDAGATLGGISSLGGEVEVNGTMDPGGPEAGLTTGSMSVQGNVTFNTGSSLAINIEDGQFDSIAVGGTLDISQAALKVKPGAGGTQLPYVIATFANRIGTFASVPAGTTVVYHTNTIEITAVGTPYQSWIGGYFAGETDPAITGADADPDHDGSSNAMEFALGGEPNNAADNAKVFPFAIGSSDTGTAKGLLLTIAVLEGTPLFEGSPSPTASAGGYTYKIQGSTDLDGFESTVSVVDPVTTNLAPAPDGYEYRSFKLDASDGLPSQGFLRVDVAPAP
ncbi:LamG-like jellyroll fold domain-containing protein [Luteolibacter sp. Populi]|uniref:LamG-like jellyroll fold domain-containing protein n=1 Tax=Luteolibacter sp. Populi TaxID=3230487 RepID=UPI003465B1DD